MRILTRALAVVAALPLGVVAAPSVANAAPSYTCYSQELEDVDFAEASPAHTGPYGAAPVLGEVSGWWSIDAQCWNEYHNRWFRLSEAGVPKRRYVWDGYEM